MPVVRVLIRSYFSSRLLWMAQRQAYRAGEIETAYAGGDPRFNIEHHGSVLSAVINASAFLEAMANELYQDAADDHGTTGDAYLAPLTGETRIRMAQLWRETRGMLQPMSKYQMLLTFAGKEAFDVGAQPYQGARDLLYLRNALVHFTPESVSVDDPHAMEKRLRAKFADNAFMAGTGNAWWPDFCLGHGCADWACRSALAVTDHVADVLGIDPNYRRLIRSGWDGLGGPPIPV